MTEKKVFFFQVTASNKGTYAANVRARNLPAAKDCIEKHPGVVAAREIDESEIPDDVRAKMGEPIECPDGPGFTYAGYKQQ